MMNGLDRMRGRIVGGSGGGAAEAADGEESYWRGSEPCSCVVDTSAVKPVVSIAIDCFCRLTRFALRLT